MGGKEGRGYRQDRAYAGGYAAQQVLSNPALLATLPTLHR